jgi:DNA-binding MurR/RpiR family transcriptional regulator
MDGVQMSKVLFEELVKEKYVHLSPGQKRVAEYLLQNLEKASYDTLAKIAKETNVSETTVIRLSYALGLNSFSEMQKCIQEQILDTNNQSSMVDNFELTNGSNWHVNIIDKDIRLLKRTVNQLDKDQLDQIINEIIQAEKVEVVGSRTSYSAAHWFATTLGYLRENVKLVPSDKDSFDQLLSITDKSLVVAISFPRYAKETYHFAMEAKERGATIVSVTDNKLSPIGRISDFVLITNSNRDETGFNSVATVISLLNLIIVGIRKKDHKRINARLQGFEELYSKHDILFE